METKKTVAIGLVQLTNDWIESMANGEWKDIYSHLVLFEAGKDTPPRRRSRMLAEFNAEWQQYQSFMDKPILNRCRVLVNAIALSALRCTAGCSRPLTAAQTLFRILADEHLLHLKGAQLFFNRHHHLRLRLQQQQQQLDGLQTAAYWMDTNQVGALVSSFVLPDQEAGRRTANAAAAALVSLVEMDNKTPLELWGYAMHPRALQCLEQRLPVGGVRHGRIVWCIMVQLLLARAQLDSGLARVNWSFWFRRLVPREMASEVENECLSNVAYEEVFLTSSSSSSSSAVVVAGQQQEETKRINHAAAH